MIVMLFLTMMSLFALYLFNTSLLETKMTNYYQNKIQAFYKAETLLIQYEYEVLSGKNIVSAELIDSTSSCGVVFYRIIAEAEYNGARSKLQSTLAKLDSSIHCDLKPKVTNGRQSFLVHISVDN